MTNKIDDGGPAFPRTGDEDTRAQEGMSLRDYFAGLYIQGTVASGKSLLYGPHSQRAYIMADEMLAARKMGVED